MRALLVIGTAAPVVLCEVGLGVMVLCFGIALLAAR